MNALVQNLKNYGKVAIIGMSVAGAGVIAKIFYDFKNYIKEHNEQAIEATQISAIRYQQDEPVIKETIADFISNRTSPLIPVPFLKPLFTGSVEARLDHNAPGSRYIFETASANVAASFQGDENNCTKWSIDYSLSDRQSLRTYNMEICPQRP